MDLRLEDFKHSVIITPRFADTDIMGHVNNAKYVTYLEEARIQYARDVFDWNGEASKIGMILAKTQIDYLLPLHIGNTIQVHTRCSRIGRKSFDLTYVMVLVKGDRLVASATTTMVAYDYTREASIMVSDSWRERMIAYEKLTPANQ